MNGAGHAVPVVSVCVSTYDRPEMLARLLAAVAAQESAADLEVCVCDDGSPTPTGLVLNEWRERLALRTVRLDTNGGPARGRNAALALATAPVVLFTDDDCVPQPGWVAGHLAAHADAASEGPAGVVVVGRVVPDPAEADREGPFSRTLRVEDARFFQTCNVSYPRDLLEAVGGFDETFRRPSGEDTDLGLRCLALGATAVFAPDALVWHGVRASSWRTSLREAVRWADVPLVVRKHPGVRADRMHRRWFWKASHPPTLLALAGLLVAPRHSPALLLLLPWLRFRTRVWPVRASRSRRPVVLAGQLVIDGAEVATMVRGSVRHRTLVL